MFIFSIPKPSIFIYFFTESLSIDLKNEAWEKAIKEDNLPWQQVLDNDKFIYSLYLLSSLPSNFLINKQGEIIKKNINAEQLNTFLAQL